MDLDPKEYTMKCDRCGSVLDSVGMFCDKCTRELADEKYLDEGGINQVHEDMDRKITGEYAEANEGDDDLSDQEGVL